MDALTARRLLDLNKQFYQTFGKEFAATRRRLQPGVQRILGSLNGSEAILDLGCGSGELARRLARLGYTGAYTGLDFSLPLLEQAPGSLPGNFHFVEADLAGDWEGRLAARAFDRVFAFAVLHHLPGAELRRSLLRKAGACLRPGGRLVLSVWQFLASEKLRRRIQPWEAAGLAADKVDPDDYLLDWRQGGRGLRYVHAFDEAELADLAAASGFRVREAYFSDGEGGKLGLYQVWTAQASLERKG